MADRPVGFVGRSPTPGLQRGHARVIPDAPGPVFDALADPTRRSLVAMLGERGAASATELARGLPVTRQAVVKHLGALAAAGLATGEREGREVRYRLTPAPLSEAAAWMAHVGAEWDERLAALEEHLRTR
ncbi:MAG: ArsR/SmtB family transcription factor [Solirubrobacteraceae bacterium]